MQYNHHLPNEMKMKNKMAQDKRSINEISVHSTIQKKLLNKHLMYRMKWTW